MARHGYPVHPLAPGTKVPAANCASCHPAAHRPENCPCHGRRRWCHGFHAATTDPGTIRGWWTREPNFGIGIACGPAGLVVIDVDFHTTVPPDRQRLLPGIPVHEDVDLTGLQSGFDTLALLAAYRRRPDPCGDLGTLRVRTPSGGMHVWYRAPYEGPKFKSSTGSSGRVALAWQVDIRAANGYIVAPGSETETGAYRALPGARHPAQLPLWLAAELTRTGHTVADIRPPRVRVARAAHPSRPAQRVFSFLLDAVRACAAAPSGMAFSEKLNRAAFTAGGFVASGYLSAAESREQLLAAAVHARPHQSRRSARIIESGLRAGGAYPIEPRNAHEQRR
ncbi:bifunctional DNA primase/polymerase [Streptomyces sp. NPDC096030]|uniref:bifunctional DNA primase/polymerase n=1 Tax=Streptomyces sp. NPDC096030 TaxID=3155423 RepID=UPI00331C4CA1